MFVDAGEAGALAAAGLQEGRSRALTEFFIASFRDAQFEGSVVCVGSRLPVANFPFVNREVLFFLLEIMLRIVYVSISAADELGCK